MAVTGECQLGASKVRFFNKLRQTSPCVETPGRGIIRGKESTMRHIHLAAVIAGLVLLACAPSELPTSTADSTAPDEACTPAGNLNFVCGLGAPEDLVVVPGTGWLVASGPHAIDAAGKSTVMVFGVGMANIRADLERFPTCPGPLDPGLAILHGLNLRPAANGLAALYATNHGGRESVEVFDWMPATDRSR